MPEKSLTPLAFLYEPLQFKNTSQPALKTAIFIDNKGMRILLIWLILTALLSGCSSGPPEIGYIDKSGRFIVEPKLQGAAQFTEGLAIACISEGKRGIINTAGQWIIPPSDNALYPYSEGLAKAQKKSSGPIGYIDRSGHIVIEPRFAFTSSDFKEGLAQVKEQSSGKEGFIDKTGKLIIERANAGSFSEGLAPFHVTDPNYKQNGIFRTGYIDKSGKVVIKPMGHPKYRGSVQMASFFDGRALMMSDGQHYGYIDTRGKYVIPAIYTEANDFHEGMALVCLKPHDCGFIDTSGQMLIKVNSIFTGPFSEGLAPIQVGKRYGFIGKDGRMVIAAKFDSLEPFSEGLAVAGFITSGNANSAGPHSWHFGYINKAGQIVIKPQFERAGAFKNGRAVVCVRNCNLSD